MKRNIGILLMFSLLIWACGSEPSGQNTAKPAPKKESQEIPQASKTSKKNILFFGNSLTAAYGLDPSEGFVGIIGRKLEAANLPYYTVNSGNSGETTAGGNSRIDWVLEQQSDIDIFILELGGNDGLRGIDPKDSYKNLKSIIDKVKAKDPNIKIVLAGMEAPPNMGPEFTAAFRGNYKRLAEEYQLPLIPFLLDGVGGIPELNLEDGIHPTIEGHKIVAENIWKILNPLLENTNS